MRWPFGPPHLTLKPSKKNKKKQKTKKQKKRGKHKKRKQRKKKKTQKYQKKRAFQLSVNFFFFGGCPKFPFLTTWPKSAHPKKHYKNRGFREHIFEKQFWVTKRPFLDKRTKSRNSSYHISFCRFLLLQQQKTTKISWNPYFYSVLANPPKDNFQNLSIKHRKLKNPIFAPFLKKAIFRKLANNWTQKRTHTHTMITEQKKSPETPIFIVRKWPWTS